MDEIFEELRKNWKKTHSTLMRVDPKDGWSISCLENTGFDSYDFLLIPHQSWTNDELGIITIHFGVYSS